MGFASRQQGRSATPGTNYLTAKRQREEGVLPTVRDTQLRNRQAVEIATNPSLARDQVAAVEGWQSDPILGGAIDLNQSLAENLIALPGDTAIEKGLELGAARAGELLGVVTRAPEVIADLVGAEEQAETFRRQSDYVRETMIEPIFGSRENIQARDPEGSWEEVKQAWNNDPGARSVVGSVASYMAAEGLGSVPDLVAMMYSLPVYFGVRGAEITQERADISGEPTEASDVAIGYGTAAASVLIDRLALTGLFRNVQMDDVFKSRLTDAFGRQIAKASEKATVMGLAGATGRGAVVEGSTEGVQEYIESIGAQVNDDEFFQDLKRQLGNPANFEAAIAGSIAGAGVGGAVAGADYYVGRRQPGEQTTVNVNEGPSADEEAAVGGIPELPGPEAPVALLPAPEPSVLVTPPPQQVPEERPEDEASGIPELPDVVAQDGELTPVAPPPTLEAIPEDADVQGMMDDITTQENRLRQQTARGQRLRATPLGQFIVQAARGEQVGDTAAQTREETAAYQVENLVENTARYLSYLSRQIRNQAREDLADPNRRDRASQTRARDADRVGTELEAQAQQYQELYDDVRRVMRGDTDAVPVDAIIGAIGDQIPVFQRLGVPIGPLGKAVRENDVPAVREAIAGMNQWFQSRLQSAESRGGDTTLVERGVGREQREILDPQARRAREFQADAQQAGRTSGRSTAPTATPEGLYAEEYTDEEGTPRTRLAAPKGSEEAIQRRREIRERDAAQERRAVGYVTNYERPGPQYEDVLDEGEQLVARAQPVRRLPEDTRSNLAAARQGLREAIRDKDRKAQAYYRGEIRVLQKQIETGQVDLEEQKPSEVAAERPEGASRERAPSSKQRILEAQRARVFKTESEKRRVATEIELADAKLAAAERQASLREAEERKERQRLEKERAAREAKAEQENQVERVAPKTPKTPPPDLYQQRVTAQNRISQLRRKLQAEKQPQVRDQLKAELKDMQAELQRLDQMRDRPTAEGAKEPSGPVKKPEYGVSKERIDAARKAWKRFKKNPPKKGPTPGTLAELARQTAQQKIGEKGMPGLMVYNPAETNFRKALGFVRGAFPKREIIRGKDGRIVAIKRAVPHSPGDKAPFAALKNKTFYKPEDIIVYQGRRVAEFQERPGGGVKPVYAAVKQNEARISPKAMDDLLVALGEHFDWGDQQPDELALAQYLIGQQAGKPKERAARKTPEEIIDERMQPLPDPEETGTDDGVSDEDLLDVEQDNPFEDDSWLDYLIDIDDVPDGDADPTQRQRWVEQIRTIEQRLSAAEVDLPHMEDRIVATPVGDEGLVVRATPGWPSDYGGTYTAIEDGDVITNSTGLSEMPKDPALSLDENMHRFLMNQLETVMQADRMILADLRKKVEDYDAKRGEAPAGDRKKKTRDRSSEGAADLPVTIPDEADAEARGDDGGRLSDDDARVYGQEPVDPDSRTAVDLYDGIGPSDSSIAAFVDRARAFQFSGAGAVKGLNKTQVRGVALMLKAWEKAQRVGYGGFLNLDGTGLGKSRQVAAGATLIAQAESEKANPRSVLILVPGGSQIKNNEFARNITREWENMGIDAKATHADGTPHYVFKNYTSLIYKDTTPYAAALADEAHSVKGQGKWGPNFAALDTEFRAFFTATPTDMPGQEIYYLQHIARQQGESVPEAAKRIANFLGLVPNPDKNKDGYVFPNTGIEDIYVQRLDELMRPIVEDGDAVSRTYGRISDNFVTDVSVARIPGDAGTDGEYIDREAERIYNERLKAGDLPTDPHMVMLTEHMKLPYMIARAKQQIRDGRKVLAVFHATTRDDRTEKGKPRKSKLADTPFVEPAILRFTRAMGETGIAGSTLYGESKSGDQVTLDAFQADNGYMWLAMSDARGATGINLNDTTGVRPRYMMIARTSLQGERFMQLLGRHDRNNNRTKPYTDFVKVNNPTDLAYRRGVAGKIKLQEQIAQIRRGRDLQPESFPTQIYEEPEYLSKLREARVVSDDSDMAVVDAIGEGMQRDVRSVLRVIEANASDPTLQGLAGDLLALPTGWDNLKAQTIAPEESVALGSQGLYDPRRETITVSAENGAAQVFLHEVVHHFTHKAISNDEAVAGELNAIMQATRAANPTIAERFPDAFLSPHEFTTEAYTDGNFQAELANTFLSKDSKLSVFDRFVRWVQRLLRVSPAHQTALERVMDLQLLRRNNGVDFDSQPLDKLRPPNLGPRVAKALPQLEAVSEKIRPVGAWHRGRAAMIWTMTYNQIVDTYRKLANRPVESGKPGGNVLDDMLRLHEDMNADANRNNQVYQQRIITPLRKFATGTGKKLIKVRMRKDGPVETMTQLEYLAHLMNISGYGQVHFGKAVGDRDNRMLKTSADARAAWKVHKRQFDHADLAELRDLYNSTARFFEQQRNAKAQMMAAAYLDTIYPDAKVPWAEREWKDIKAEINRITSLTDEGIKAIGATRDALDSIRQVLQPGVVPGAYFPLKRYGKYVVVADGADSYTSDAERDALLQKYPFAKDNPKTSEVTYKTVARFETHGEAQRYADKLREDYAEAIANKTLRVTDAMLKAESMQVDIGNSSFSALMNNFQRNLAKREGLSAKDRSALENVFAQTLLDMMPETSTANAMRERQGIYGASLDIQRVLHNYGASQGFLMANLKHSRRKTQLANELNWLAFDLETRAKNEGPGSKLYEDAIALRQVQEALTSRNATASQQMVDLGNFGQTLTDIGFLYYLVGASYNLVNATQVPLVAGPYLAARYGAEATTKALGRAYKMAGAGPVMRLLKTGGSLTELRQIFSGKDFDLENYDVVKGEDGILERLQDKNHRQLINDLVIEGHIEASLTMDMARNSERAHVDENGQPVKTNAWTYLTDWMRMAPHITEVMNRSVVAVATFDLEYRKHQDYEKAKTAARDAIKQTQFVYQFWNKPPAFQNQLGRLALMFKQHVQHMYYYMIRNAAVSISQMSSPQEKKVARRALGYFVLMHVMAAGAVGGTPELLKWLINLGWWASGQDEPLDYDRRMRNLAYDLFGEPGATFAAQGLPGFIGMDLSGRVGIDSMLLFDGINLSSREGFAESVVSTAGGPLAGLFFRGVDARSKIQSGMYGRALEDLMPKAIRDPVRAARLKRDGFTDLSGKTYLEPEEFTWWDFGQQMIGFSPKTSSDIYASRAVGQTRVRMMNKRERLFTRFYNADTVEQRQAVIDDIRKWNADNPAFAISRDSLIRSVRQRRRIEAQTTKGVYTPRSQQQWAAEEQRSYQE